MNLKELTEEDILNLNDVQLYNIVFGPVADLLQSNQNYSNDDMGKTCVAVFGATAIPISRRIKGLADFCKNGNNPKMIIFSGGYSWDGISSRKYSLQELKDIWRGKDGNLSVKSNVVLKRL